jgi:DNA-binding response OmpR family regulator
MMRHNPKVLIIDDEPDICFLLGSMLKKKNIETSFANTLSEGFAKLKDLQPELLFLDLNLTDGSGLEAIPKIKNEFPNIKIIIISAYDGSKERITAEEAGAEYFIGKPFDREKVFGALKKVW